MNLLWMVLLVEVCLRVLLLLLRRDAVDGVAVHLLVVISKLCIVEFSLLVLGGHHLLKGWGRHLGAVRRHLRVRR